MLLSEVAFRRKDRTLSFSWGYLTKKVSGHTMDNHPKRTVGSRCVLCGLSGIDHLPGLESLMETMDGTGPFDMLEAKRIFNDQYDQNVSLTQFKRHVLTHLEFGVGEDPDDITVYNNNL